jgi:adhesin transport system outer membrane protein
VNRYRTLTEYASRNLQQHEAIAKMIEKRIRAGIDSKVDMETVKGRVALARANLLTEESNLHDAETQFIRVIGTSPGDLHDASLETAHLPSSAEAALEEVFKGSPQLFAAVEHSLSMDSALAEQGARMRPTLDLRAGLNLEEDVDGVSGRRDETYVELLLRWNLYNGGSDQATIHRFEELYKQSRENVKRVERDIRQAVLIAYNNIISLRKQITHLEQHKTSAEIMREAFEKQFVVGRRSLLDLLDAENEVFQAKRAFLNAKVNLSIAQAEYMAETGKLVNYFKTTRQDVPQPDDLGIDVVTYQSLQAD